MTTVNRDRPGLPAADALVNPDPNTVTVWSDIGCPWATLALAALHAEARRLDVPVSIDHRAFPLELFNRRPTPKPLLDTEVEGLLRALPELGWRPWHAPDATYPVTTLPAMEAVQACRLPEVGGLAAGDALDTALRAAFYRDSLCISTPAVILEIADSCPTVDTDRLADAIAKGAGRTEVYEQWEVAKWPHVQGSPHIFTAAGANLHNPGAAYRWDQTGGEKVLALTEYRQEWATELLTTIAAH